MTDNKPDEREDLFSVKTIREYSTGKNGEAVIVHKSFEDVYGAAADSMRVLRAGMKVMNDLRGSDDRAYVIVSIAFFEELLLRLIRRGAIECRATNSLLGHKGGLGTFGAKVDACEAFGLIRADSARELRALGEIRNKFAHRFDINSLTDLAKSCESLSAYKLYAEPGRKPLAKNAREKFEVSIFWIHNEITKAWHYARPRTPPPDGPVDGSIPVT